MLGALAASLRLVPALRSIARAIAKGLFWSLALLGLAAGILAVFVIGALFIAGVFVILIGAGVVLAVCAMAEGLADWVRR